LVEDRSTDTSWHTKKKNLVSVTNKAVFNFINRPVRSVMNLRLKWLTTILLLQSSSVLIPVNGFVSSFSLSSTVPLLLYHHHHARLWGRMPLYAQQQSSRLAADPGNNDRTVELVLLERKVSSMTLQLEQEERRATQARNDWVAERTQLVHKISGLTILLQESQQQQQQQPSSSLSGSSIPYEEDEEEEKEDTIQALTLELSMSRESEQELTQEMDRLEREVKLLQHQIVQIRNLYKTEQYIVQDLEAQLQVAQQQRHEEQVEWQRLAEAQKQHLDSLTKELLKQQQQQPQYLASSSSSSTTTSHGYSQRNETLSAVSAYK
jgi:hypothetical protein